MLYSLIRFLIGGLLFFVLHLMIKRSKIMSRRRLYIIAFVVSVSASAVFGLFPFENAVYTFPSPEASFRYNHTGNVQLVVAGTETDWVIARKDNTTVHEIIPHAEGGWKLGMGTDEKLIVDKVYNETFIHIYRYKDSEEYYAHIFRATGDELNIRDNRNSSFRHASQRYDAQDLTFHEYYVYLQDFNAQYILIIDGQEISFAT